jgi:hypothetical protein
MVGLLTLALAQVTWAVPGQAQERVDWHGYAQLRFTDGSDIAGFAIRRAKLWIEGPVPVDTHLHVKLQGLFRPADAGAFVLQDVYAEYRWELGAARVGQMVPDFALQRQQPDYAIPLVERAAVINVLVPAATTMARDVGAQLTLGPAHGPWHASVGLFNGNGANHLANDDKRFLGTARATYAVALPGGVQWEFGGSASYRRSAGLDLGPDLGARIPFAGTDIRWGVESRLTASQWELQGEFLHAALDTASAWGWYALAAYSITPRNEIVVSAEQLRIPNPEVAGDPWYIVGFNHYIARDNAKVMLDGRAQPAGPGTNYAAVAQLQLFFR